MKHTWRRPTAIVAPPFTPLRSGVAALFYSPQPRMAVMMTSFGLSAVLGDRWRARIASLCFSDRVTMSAFRRSVEQYYSPSGFQIANAGPTSSSSNTRRVFAQKPVPEAPATLACWQ